jgi:hypothetical protein
MYQDLLEMERKLDWTMTRKRVEVQDALGRIPTVSPRAEHWSSSMFAQRCCGCRRHGRCGYS